MNDEKNFFGVNGKYVDLDDSAIILDDSELDFDPEPIDIKEVEDNDLTSKSNAQELVDEKESKNNIEIIEVPEAEETKEPIVELLDDEDLKPKTNESLYKMIVETLADDKKLMKNEPVKEAKKTSTKNTKIIPDTAKTNKIEVDNLLNNLNNGVDNTNEYFLSVIRKKKELEELEEKLLKDKTEFETQKAEFEKYRSDEINRLDSERFDYSEFMEQQKTEYAKRLQLLEDEKNRELEQINFIKEALDEDRKNLEIDKKSFAKLKELEEQKIDKKSKKIDKDKEKLDEKIKIHNTKMKQEKEKIAELVALKTTELNSKIDSFEKEKELFETEKEAKLKQLDLDQTILNDLKAEKESEFDIKAQELEYAHEAFETEKNNFNKYKELEEKRLKYENDQLNSQFEKLNSMIVNFNHEFKSNLDENR